jgi:DNA-binding NarL/FixJ family response regulator
MTPIRVLLADDHRMFVDGLRACLALEADINVIGEASTGVEAIELVALLHPDIVVMDIRMPILNGIEATRRVRATYPQCQVILLTTFKDDEYVFEGVCAGAVGYLLKDGSSEMLAQAIRAVHQGQSLLHPLIARKMIEVFTRFAPSTLHPSGLADLLSEREQDVLRLVAQACTNRAIADRLHITEATVKRHMSNILAKLDVTDRLEAADVARRHGLG